jgi:hypothetical protein
MTRKKKSWDSSQQVDGPYGSLLAALAPLARPCGLMALLVAYSASGAPLWAYGSFRGLMALLVA